MTLIGYEPLIDTMVIIPGQDFSHWFGVEPDDPFPAGTDLIMRIFDREGTQVGAWPAITVQPGGAKVQITAEDLAVIPDSAVFRVHVEYADGTDLVWIRGRVWRRF